MPAGNFGDMTIDEPVTIALADSQGNIWGDDGPMPGDETRFIGKAWCLGVMEDDAVDQDGLGKTGDNGPLDRGTGFTCDGAPVDNVTQTDSMTADIAFHAEQARHNGEFTCEPLPERTTITVVKEVTNDDNGTSAVEDFSYFVEDVEVLSGEALLVTSGTYQISETGPDGYNATFGGDCDANGSVTVAEFDQAVCTITNDDVGEAELTIDKLVTFTSPGLTASPSDFPFVVTNDSTLEETAFSDEVAGNLAPGTYTISESYVGAQNITFEATYSGDCSEIGTTDTATITVGEGDVAACQVFNVISENLID